MRSTVPGGLAIALVMAAGSARADDAPHCTVDVARAPAEVRSTIESWVAAEPHCAHTIEVRVVPTEGGYYLYARDEHGVVRERIVPDAQAAGVLVASWVADDSPVAPVTPIVTPIMVPPRTTAPSVEARGRAVAPARHHSGVLLGFGGHASMAKGYAVRGEVALETRGWQVYGAASVGQTQVAYDFAGDGSRINLMPIDRRVALGLGREFGTGLWQARVRAGIQSAAWTGDFSSSVTPDHINVTFAGFEGALQVSRKLTPAWSFTAGLDFSKFVDTQQSSFDGSLMVIGPAFELGLTAGLDVKL